MRSYSQPQTKTAHRTTAKPRGKVRTGSKDWPWESDQPVHVLVEDGWVRGRVGRSEPRNRRFCVRYKKKHGGEPGPLTAMLETEWIEEPQWASEVKPTDTDSDDDSDNGDTSADAHSEASDAGTVCTAQSATSATSIISDAVEEQRVAGERYAAASRRVAGLVRARSSPTSGGNPSKRTARDEEAGPDLKKDKGAGRGAGRGARAAPAGTIRRM